jgi:hypothetical protein
MARKRNTENDIVVSAGAAAVPARRQTTAARPRRTAVTKTKPVAVVEEAVVIAASAPIEDIRSSAAPTREEVAALAYSYWETRGCQGGSPEEDWLRAEQEILSRSGAKA